jgi:hypothetical protein
VASESGIVHLDSDLFAKHLDAADPLGKFRESFQFPKKRELPIGKRKRWCF